jgi:hypothetical protein
MPIIAVTPRILCPLVQTASTGRGPYWTIFRAAAALCCALTARHRRTDSRVERKYVSESVAYTVVATARHWMDEAARVAIFFHDDAAARTADRGQTL